MDDLEEVLNTNEDTSRAVGVNKFLETLYGSVFELAGEVPVVGQPLTRALGTLATPFDRAQQMMLTAADAIREQRDADDVFSRTLEALAGERRISREEFLENLGVEDPSGFASFALGFGLDAVTGGALSKAARPAGKAVRAGVEKLAPGMKVRRLEREAGTARGVDLSETSPYGVARIEEQLLRPQDEALAAEQARLVASARKERQYARTMQQEGVRSLSESPIMTDDLGNQVVPGMLGVERFMYQAAERQRALAKSREYAAQARKVRDNRPSRIMSGEIELKSQKEFEAFADEFDVMRTRNLKIQTRGEARKLGLKPDIGSEPAMFSGRIVDGMRDGSDWTKGITLALSRKALPDPKFAGFFLGRFLPVRNVMEKLGFLQPLLRANSLYHKAYDDAIRAAKQEAKRLGIKQFSESDQRIAASLRGVPVELTPNEAAFKAYWREKTDWLADQLKLPLDKRQADYFTAMREQAPLWAEGFGGIKYTEDIGYVVDPYLMQKTGETIGRQSALEAFQVYHRAGLRKLHFDPTLKELSPVIARLPEKLKDTAKGTVGVMIGRPSVLDQKIGETIAAVTGAQLNVNRVSRISLGVTNWLYRGLIGGKLGTVLAQLTGSVNTMAQMGIGRTLHAMAQMAGVARMPAGLNRRQVFQHIQGGLREAMESPLAIEHGGPKALLARQIGHRANQILLGPASWADRVTRGFAYLAGVNERMDRGFSLDSAMKYGARIEQETQFLYGALGKSQLTQSSILAPLWQFAHYPLNQVNRYIQQAMTGQFETMLRTAVLAGWASSVAQDAGIDLTRIETPLTMQDVNQYLSLKAFPAVRVLSALAGLADVDLENPEDARRWSVRLVEASKAFIPILPGLRVIPGAAEVADFSEIDQWAGIPLKGPEGLINRYVSPKDWALKGFGIQTTGESIRRENARQMRTDLAVYQDSKRDLERDIISDLETGEDWTGHAIAWIKLTGKSLSELVDSVQGRKMSHDAKTKMERMFQSLPSALKMRYAGQMAQELEQQMDPALGGMLTGVAEQAQGILAPTRQ